MGMERTPHFQSVPSVQETTLGQKTLKQPERKTLSSLLAGDG
jgi:hypothetical protein